MVHQKNIQLFSALDLTAASPSKSSGDGRASGEAPLTPAGYKWLFDDLDQRKEIGWERTKCEVVPWPKFTTPSKGDVLADLNAESVFLMNALANLAPQLTRKDIALVRRYLQNPDAPPRVEVWTERDFKANELVLVPYAHEIKDRFWTKGRSAMMRMNSKSKALKDNKTLAVDGCFRANFQDPLPPADGEKPREPRCASLFFAVERTCSRSETNLVQSYCAVSLTAQVMLPGSSKTLKKDLPRAIDIPVFTNPKPIKAHTRLQVLEDLALLEHEVKWKEESAKRIGEDALSKKAPQKKHKSSD